MFFLMEELLWICGIKRNRGSSFYYVKDRARFLKIMGEVDDEKAIKKFSGLINYVNTVDPAYLDKLRKESMA